MQLAQSNMAFGNNHNLITKSPPILKPIMLHNNINNDSHRLMGVQHQLPSQSLPKAYSVQSQPPSASSSLPHIQQFSGTNVSERS